MSICVWTWCKYYVSVAGVSLALCVSVHVRDVTQAGDQTMPLHTVNSSTSLADSKNYV